MSGEALAKPSSLPPSTLDNYRINRDFNQLIGGAVTNADPNWTTLGYAGGNVSTNGYAGDNTTTVVPYATYTSAANINAQ